MKSMTSHERISRMFEHREADRIPVTDSPWAGTIARWRREGMPADMDWRDYFKTDRFETMHVDTSPRFEAKVVEQTDRYTIRTSPWGVTMKNFNEPDSTPEFLDFTITTPAAWEEAKLRILAGEDRINWKHLEESYPRWRKQGAWINAMLWFGFDVTHSWMVGTETFLMALLDEPDWVRDVFDTTLTASLALFDKIWDAGYRFDSIFWYDDMGYKNTPFFSNETYRSLLKPYHKRAIDWAHSKGIRTHLHSCGNIMPLVPELMEIGLDALNPLEVKAGMDARKLKREYGDRLLLHGGVNAVLWDHIDLITAEIESVVPVLKENGGYIFSSDHSIPNTVSLENMRRIMDTVRRVGKY